MGLTSNGMHSRTGYIRTLGPLLVLSFICRPALSSLHLDLWERLCVVVGGRNTCSYTCPGGHIRRPKGNFTVGACIWAGCVRVQRVMALTWPFTWLVVRQPRPNGCGTDGMRVNLTRFDFVPCCNLHDLCFVSCDTTKAFCDAAFLSCMKAQCAVEAEGMPREMRKCINAARLYHGAVYGFGCKPYIAAQKKACECVPAGEEECESWGTEVGGNSTVQPPSDSGGSYDAGGRAAAMSIMIEVDSERLLEPEWIRKGVSEDMESHVKESSIQ